MTQQNSQNPLQCKYEEQVEITDRLRLLLKQQYNLQTKLKDDFQQQTKEFESLLMQKESELDRLGLAF